MAKKKDEITIRSSAAEYLTYVASVGMMATLYDVDVRTINEHIKKIYSDSELEKVS